MSLYSLKNLPISHFIHIHIITYKNGYLYFINSQFIYFFKFKTSIFFFFGNLKKTHLIRTILKKAICEEPPAISFALNEIVSTALCLRTWVQVCLCPVSVSECSVMLWWSRGEQPHGPTVTCCIFLIDGRGFIPWGGYRGPCTSVGLRDPGTGRGLTEPGSLCTDPPLPSDWPSFFLISFLSLALRFWNQIFTWKEREKKSVQLYFKETKIK